METQSDRVSSIGAEADPEEGEGGSSPGQI